MKRALALAKLDDAAGDEISLMLRTCIFQINARDQKALDEFSNGLSSLVKAYDGATRIITEKLID